MDHIVRIIIKILLPISSPIIYVSLVMVLKVVQTKLNNLEYELLRRYAESRGLTTMEALREIVGKTPIGRKN